MFDFLVKGSLSQTLENHIFWVINDFVFLEIFLVYFFFLVSFPMVLEEALSRKGSMYMSRKWVRRYAFMSFVAISQDMNHWQFST